MCFRTAFSFSALFATLIFSSLFAGGWVLQWSDEFDYTGLPSSEKWGYQTGGHGWGNDESQYYTDSREENARVEDGHLIIEARREDWGDNDYTSAKLVTQNKQDWTYGRFEIRAILPAGDGTWPAFWMMPSNGIGGWPDCGEIDIMEHVGKDQDRVHGTIHCDAYNHMIGTQKGGSINVPGSTEEYHTYIMEWDEDQIRWYVDGDQYYSFDNENTGHSTWPFYYDFYLILNIAIGGSWGGDIDNSIFPVQMLVDYVRVYNWDESLDAKNKLLTDRLTTEYDIFRSKNSFNITHQNEKILKVDLFSSSGRHILSKPADSKSVTINTSGIPSGIKIVKISTQQGYFSEKICINR